MRTDPFTEFESEEAMNFAGEMLEKYGINASEVEEDIEAGEVGGEVGGEL